MKKCSLITLISLPVLSYSVSFSNCCGPVQPGPDPIVPKTFGVDFQSETLTINKQSASNETDFIATVSIKEANYNYCLPKGVKLYVGGNYIQASDYSFDSTSGKLVVDKKFITNNLTILGEWSLVDGLAATFEHDQHIHFKFYPTREYDRYIPIEDNIAIARDPNTGLPIKDGSGEINFICEVESGFDTKTLWMRGVSDKIQEIPYGGGIIYRISNIQSNIRFCATTDRIYCKNLCASANYNNKSFNFNWVTAYPSVVSSVKVEVTHNQTTESFITLNSSFTYSNANEEELYQFKFTPILTNNQDGGSIEKNMMLSPASEALNFPRVEIFTENNMLPEYDIVSHPSSGGKAVVNNQYVQNILQIYDDDNQKVFDSSGDNPLDFSGCKMKVRGNLSTVDSNGKESYKIKLESKADLLDPFLNRSSQVEGTAYQHKEWLLLNCGNQLNELAGFSIEKSLNVAWVPSCFYVTLFLNNDFKGLYVLCESVSKGNISGDFQARCPIDDTGYIIENDSYAWEQNLTFDTQIHKDLDIMEYTFKYPDADDMDYEDERYKYIKNYVLEFESHFYKDLASEKYKDYVDVESFAKWTVAHDLMHVEDWWGSNMFIYKKDNLATSKLTAGTTWDFDSAFIGNEGSLAKGLCYHRTSTIYYIRIFASLPDFKNFTKSVYENAHDNILTDFQLAIDYIKQKETIYNQLLEKESNRFGKDQVTFSNQANQISHFLTNQINFIDTNHLYD